jgi:hypothetical protein
MEKTTMAFVFYYRIAQSVRNLTELMQHKKESMSLPVVNEDAVMKRSIRMLKPVRGPESWEEGRR